MLIYYFFSDGVSRLAEKVNRWNVNLSSDSTEAMQIAHSIEAQLNLIDEGLACIRDAAQYKSIPMHCYVPMNSRKGMRRLFRVS